MLDLIQIILKNPFLSLLFEMYPAFDPGYVCLRPHCQLLRRSSPLSEQEL
jgi:hypothetical protein